MMRPGLLGLISSGTLGVPKKSWEAMAKAKRVISQKHKLLELVRVYQDLERTLRELKSVAGNRARVSPLKHIDMRHLIDRLSQSKTRLERKIGNTLALETDQMRRRISRFIQA